jgi:hypothetical protein
VLAKLLNHDLPLDTEDVKRDLRAHNLPITTHHGTKLARQLLDKMTGTIREPAVTNSTCRRLEALSASKLAKKAKEMVEKCMFLPTEPGVPVAVLDMWKCRYEMCSTIFFLHPP